MKRIKNSRIFQRLIIMILDVLIVIISGSLAWLLRYDFDVSTIPGEQLSTWLDFAFVQAGLTLVIFHLAHMYSFVWRTVGLHDVFRMVGAVLGNFAAAMVVG